MQNISQQKTQNRLLKALTPQAFDQLQPGMEWLNLPLRTVLVESDQPTDHVFFLESGLASIVARTGDDEAIEVGHIGWEGCAAHITS